MDKVGVYLEKFSLVKIRIGSHNSIKKPKKPFDFKNSLVFSQYLESSSGLAGKGAFLEFIFFEKKSDK